MAIRSFAETSGRPGSALGALLVILWAGQATTGWAQQAGEQEFKTMCVACHTIGGGRLAGPDLAGVHDRRSPEWLHSFVKGPQAVIDSGDAAATALVAEYGLVMPAMPLSDQQITDVLAYVQAMDPAAGASAGTAEPAPATPAAPAATPEQIARGQDLFQGRIRFENRGAACNSCHEVKNDAVIGGGILAKDLTNVFSRMGQPGVAAILGQAPFPVMQAAYVKHPLTTEEVSSLVAFLQDADAKHAFQQPRDYGWGLFLSGLAGAAVLLLLFGVVWRKRRTASVYQAIYDRQVKSVTDGQY